jgi:hypothetical protein
MNDRTIRGYKTGTLITALAVAAVLNLAASMFSTSAGGVQTYTPDNLRIQALPSFSEGHPMHRFVEIRSYSLKPGVRDLFHQLVVREAVPMLLRWKVDVVAHGPSLHDSDSYYLIRAYSSPEERQQSQDAFYGSDEWRNGPREAILASIESYTTIATWLDDATVRGLRKAGRPEMLPARGAAHGEPTFESDRQ